MMARSIFDVQEIMSQMEVISEKEENRFSEIPHWDGSVVSWTDKAVLIAQPSRSSALNWIPMSQLRKSEDNLSVYASFWIIEERKLV
jgi:hypothetical protein